MYLTDLKKNNKAIIAELKCKDTIKRRLIDIGLTKDTEVQLIGKAPLGDPLLISVRGFTLAIRKSDAGCILIR